MISVARRVPRPRGFSVPRLHDLARFGPEIALGGLLVIAAVVVMALTADTTFYRDDWFFVAYRDGASITNYFAPHGGHLYVGQVLIYLLFFEVFGLDDYTPFRIVMVVVELGLGALVYAYCRRRIGSWLALLPTAIILFFGPGSDNLLWPFQASFIMPLIAGIGALIALDDDREPADRLACACFLVALVASGIALAIGAGLVADWALRPQRRKRFWIWAGPMSLWFAWFLWLGRRDDRPGADLSEAPAYVYRVATATAEGLVGIGGAAGQVLLLGLAVVLARQYLLKTGPTRQATVLLVTLLAYWSLLAVASGGVYPATSNRYLLPGAVLMVLLICELVRDWTFEGRAVGLATGLTAVILIANIGVLESSARHRQGTADKARTALGAIEIAGPQVRRDFSIDSFANRNAPIQAGPYLEAIERWGSSPALSEEQIATASGWRRTLADQVLVASLPVTFSPREEVAADRLRFPEPTRAAGGRVRRDGGCVVTTPAVADMTLDLPYPPGGLALRPTAGASAKISLRRFASKFDPFVTVSGPAPGVLRIPRDRSRRPWFVRVASGQPVRVCGVTA